MLFNSFPFILLFLPAALVGFFAIARFSSRAAAAWLAFVSLIFFGYWDARFVALLLGSILFNYAAGRGLSELHRRGCHGAKTALLAASLAANLLLLGYFKYMDFFIVSLAAAFATGWQPLHIVLPLGISFFTFTQIAYLVDTARGEVRESNLLHYTLFVSYFPHLIAGPILHHREIMPQFRIASTYVPSAENFAVGLSFLAIGLAKKCLLADSFAPEAGEAFDLAQHGDIPPLFVAWQGALAYTLQLYFDFSGYSDMAVGLSRLFGIRLPFNFASPYQATSVIDFWRRWHMTLSRFLRDYLYFPLGGNRRGSTRRYVNLMLTMLLGGLWHGANWTFAAWGALHGLYLVANHGWIAVKPARLLSHVPVGLRRLAATAVTFLAVVFAWVLFRAADLGSAMRMLQGMAGMADPAHPSADWLHSLRGLAAAALESGNRWSVLRYAAALAIVFLLPNSQTIVEGDRDRGTSASARALPLVPLAWRGNVAWGLALGALAAASVLTFAQVSEFLYYRF
jgi:D-alanyl-lipoteichoic acid acyltransferase DltB (MBOAT superfamily)